VLRRFSYAHNRPHDCDFRFLAALKYTDQAPHAILTQTVANYDTYMAYGSARRRTPDCFAMLSRNRHAHVFIDPVTIRRKTPTLSSTPSETRI
jgi:hypothetical protein